jgi:hypothetical protein
MDNSEFRAFLTKIKGYYERFEGLHDAMGVLWCEALRPIEEPLAEKALARWARQFTYKIPSLDELLEQVEFVREDEKHAMRPRTDPTRNPWLDIVRELAEKQQVVIDEETGEILRDEEDVKFGRLMALLGERTVARWVDKKGTVRDKLTLEDRAQQCEAWAMSYQYEHPGLAHDLLQVAKQYRQAQQREVA